MTISDDKLHRDVVEIYRSTALRTGNTAAAFGAALQILEKARPELHAGQARREVATMLSREPEGSGVS